MKMTVLKNKNRMYISINRLYKKRDFYLPERGAEGIQKF